MSEFSDARPMSGAEAAGRTDGPYTTGERIGVFMTLHPDVTFTDDRTAASWFDDDGPRTETRGTPEKLISYMEALWRDKPAPVNSKVQEYVAAVAAGDEKAARAIIAGMQDAGLAEPDGDGGWQVTGNG